MPGSLHRRIDVGIAVDTGEGLFTPVLKDVGDAREDVVREHFEALKKRLTDRTISREDLGGQTITLSNFGMLGGRFASLVVVPPQVAILGAGRAQSRVVAVNGAAAVHRMLPLSLTFDHRAVTGAEAAGFLAAVIAALEAGS
jgi:2-oxoisovalerate dehydrogenase E2 component (dihydrolipoyl transacylase)